MTNPDLHANAPKIKVDLFYIAHTLYVPMLGRIYAGENCRNILYDKKELELKSKTK